MSSRYMEITVIKGDLNTPGSIIEIPWSIGTHGCGPVYEVDPKTRACKTTLQRFELNLVNTHPEQTTLSLKAIPRTE